MQASSGQNKSTFYIESLPIWITSKGLYLLFCVGKKRISTAVYYRFI